MTTKHPEITAVTAETDRIACDGGGAQGHPRVWYSFEGKTEVVCGYCDRAFVKTAPHGRG